MKKSSVPGNAMDRRKWFKTSLGIAAASAFYHSLKADEINFHGRIHPHTGRWMMDESFFAPSQITARLNSNENPFGPSEKAKAAIVEGFKDANRYSRNVAKALKEKIKELTSLKVDTSPLETEYYRKISWALTPLLFILLGFPMAIITHRREKTANLLYALLFAAPYFLLSLGAQALAGQNLAPIGWVMWGPNIIAALVVGFLNIRMCLK